MQDKPASCSGQSGERKTLSGEKVYGLTFVLISMVFFQFSLDNVCTFPLLQFLAKCNCIILSNILLSTVGQTCQLVWSVWWKENFVRQKGIRYNFCSNFLALLTFEFHIVIVCLFLIGIHLTFGINLAFNCLSSVSSINGL